MKSTDLREEFKQKVRLNPEKSQNIWFTQQPNLSKVLLCMHVCVMDTIMASHTK